VFRLYSGDTIVATGFKKEKESCEMIVFGFLNVCGERSYPKNSKRDPIPSYRWMTSYDAFSTYTLIRSCAIF
jgi:hypothetical protein